MSSHREYDDSSSRKRSRADTYRDNSRKNRDHQYSSNNYNHRPSLHQRMTHVTTKLEGMYRLMECVLEAVEQLKSMYETSNPQALQSGGYQEKEPGELDQMEDELVNAKRDGDGWDD